MFFLDHTRKMNHDYFLQILFMFFLLISLTSGRTLFYDELDSDDYQGKNKSLFLL